MNPSEQEQLLKEVLTGEDVAGFRGESLDRTLHALRRRRSRRRVAGALAAASMALILTIGVVMNRTAHSTAPRLAATSDSRPANFPSRTDTAGVEIITDEELFALFPDRPLALIGEPGRQRFVVLDSLDRNFSEDFH